MFFLNQFGLIIRIGFEILKIIFVVFNDFIWISIENIRSVFYPGLIKKSLRVFFGI